MAENKKVIKFIHAALDEESTTKSIILRGVITPESLELLQVGSYQREILPHTRISALTKAFRENASLPDIDLGMRGGDFSEKDGAFYLKDDVFIVDGLQRVTAAKRFLKEEESCIPRLGAIVHFNTDETWERERFRVLNTMRAKLSTNILIRNMMPEYPVVEMLYNLTRDSTSPLYNRVCWNQRMKRGELLSATAFVRAAAYLHSRLGMNLKQYGTVNLIPHLQKVYNKLGRTTIRNNVKEFWEMMDECFKLNLITYKEGSTPIKGGFLDVFTVVLAEHSNFWEDTRLSVDRDLRKKIALFPVSDPEISRMASAGGAATDILYQLVTKHINSGKRTKRLVPFRKSITKEESVA